MYDYWLTLKNRGIVSVYKHTSRKLQVLVENKIRMKIQKKNDQTNKYTANFEITSRLELASRHGIFWRSQA